MDRPDLRGRAKRQRHHNRLPCSVTPAILYKKISSAVAELIFFIPLLLPVPLPMRPLRRRDFPHIRGSGGQ